MILNSVSLVAGGRREGAFRVKVFLYANTAETAETAWVCSVEQPGSQHISHRAGDLCDRAGLASVWLLPYREETLPSQYVISSSRRAWQWVWRVAGQASYFHNFPRYHHHKTGPPGQTPPNTAYLATHLIQISNINFNDQQSFLITNWIQQWRFITGDSDNDCYLTNSHRDQVNE